MFGTRTMSKPNYLGFLLSVKITARGFTLFRTKCTLHSGSTPEPLCNVQLYPGPLTEDESGSAEWQAIAVKRGFSRNGHANSGLRRSVGASGHSQGGIFLEVNLVKVYRPCETPFRPL
jgi:hypothetical protein